jgi:hypothetical protein
METKTIAQYVGSIAVIMALFLSGCATTMQTLVYGKPISENQSAVLIIPDAYIVTNFDGESVKWMTSSDGFSLFGSSAAIKLPSGQHNITYSYYRHSPGQTTYEHYASGAIVQRTTFSRATSFDGNITINMDPGKIYIFKGRGIVIDTNNQHKRLP